MRDLQTFLDAEERDTVDASAEVVLKPADVRRAAMNLLARREHSTQELSQKLSRKFAGLSDEVSKQINKLKAEGLQSDTRLAEAYVRSKVRSGQGPVKIKAGLRSKGITDAEISSAIAETGVDWSELAKDVLVKRFGDDLPSDAKTRAKRARFLAQRGFSFDQIRLAESLAASPDPG